MITITTLDRDEIKKTISNTRIGGKLCDEYLQISGLRKDNLKQLPKDIQKQVDDLIGHKKMTVIVRQE